MVARTMWTTTTESPPGSTPFKWGSTWGGSKNIRRNTQKEALRWEEQNITENRPELLPLHNLKLTELLPPAGTREQDHDENTVTTTSTTATNDNNNTIVVSTPAHPPPPPSRAVAVRGAVHGGGDQVLPQPENERNQLVPPQVAQES